MYLFFTYSVIFPINLILIFFLCSKDKEDLAIMIIIFFVCIMFPIISYPLLAALIYTLVN